MKIAACVVSSDPIEQWKEMFESWGTVDYFIEDLLGKDHRGLFSQLRRAVFKKCNKELFEQFEYDAVIVMLGKVMLKKFVFPNIEPATIYSHQVAVTRWPGVFVVSPKFFIADSCTANMLTDYYHSLSFIREQDVLFDPNITRFLPNRTFYYHCVMTGTKVAKLEIHDGV